MAESKLNFSFCRESPSFHIVNHLKSFDFKLFFVCTSKVFKGPFWHICTYFCFILSNTNCFRAY